MITDQSTISSLHATFTENNIIIIAHSMYTVITFDNNFIYNQLALSTGRGKQKVICAKCINKGQPIRIVHVSSSVITL